MKNIILRATLALILTFSLSTCSMIKLGKDLEVLYNDLVIISGNLQQEPLISGQPIAILSRFDGSTYHFIDYRFPDGSGAFHFQAQPQQAQPGEFRLLAFSDLNKDFKYNKGEPIVEHDKPLVYNTLQTSDDNWLINSIELRHDSRLIVDLDINVSEQAVATLNRSPSTMAVPVDFASTHFSDENTQAGLWEPSRFLLETGYGLYYVGTNKNESFHSNNDPLILFVHGINGSPKNFEALLPKLNTNGSKVALFHYPSGLGVDDNAYMLGQILNELYIRAPQQEIIIVAHSMGGIVARQLINRALVSGDSDRIKAFISIAVPWAGHKAAQAGKDYAPVVIPVWEDLAPQSELMATLHTQDLPAALDYTLIFSYAGHSMLQREANDGSVSIPSQLLPAMQDRANTLIGVNSDHVGVLTDPRTVDTLNAVLKKQLAKRLEK